MLRDGSRDDTVAGVTNETATGGRVSRRRFRVLLLVVLAVAVFLRLTDFTDPWSEKGWHALGAQLSNGARNLVEHGYLELRLAPTLDGAPPPDGAPWRFYTNHPPLLVLALAASFEIFGVVEWAARLVAVLASLGALLGTVFLARRLFGDPVALVTAALMATLPVTAFYGTLVDGLGPLLIALIVLGCCCWWRALEAPTRGRLAQLAGALFLAGLANWQGVEAAALIAVVSWCGGQRRIALAAGAAALSVPLLHLAHQGWVQAALPSAPNTDLLDAFFQRTWGGLEPFGGAGPALSAVAHHLRRLYGLPVLALAIVGLTTLRRAPRPAVVLTLAGFALLDMLVFLEGSARHSFWNALLAPAALMLAGAGLVSLAGRLPSASLRTGAILVVTVGIAGWGVLETRDRFADAASTYSRDLGTIIADKTDPDDQILLCESLYDPLKWYARRRMVVGVDDTIVKRRGLPESAGFTVAVVPRRAYSPHEHALVEELLRKRHPLQRVTTEALGTVLVFDLTRNRRTTEDR